MDYKPVPGQRVEVMDNRGICRIASEYECGKHTPLTKMAYEGRDAFVGVIDPEGRWVGWWNWQAGLTPIDHMIECPECNARFLLEDHYLCPRCR